VLQGDGSTMRGPNESLNALSPIGLGGLGWDFLPRTRVPISLFADVGGLGRYAQGAPFEGGLVFTAGLAYQFGTGRPRTAYTEVPPTPPAVAPPNTDSPLPPGVPYETPAAPAPGPLGPAEPAPPAQPEPPQLPPPPTVPASPAPSAAPAPAR
jgi:hypothetical protein